MMMIRTVPTDIDRVDVFEQMCRRLFVKSEHPRHHDDVRQLIVIL